MANALLALLRGLTIAATLFAAAPAAAQDSPRAATHDGYGRMVFDWNGAVTHAAEVVGDTLVVRFSQAVAGDPRAVLKPLDRYVRDVAISPDRKVLTFKLARPVQVKAFVVGKSVVVDLLGQPGQFAQAGQPAPAVAPAAGVPTVPVRSGEHTGFHRMVFEWPRQVDYKVDKAGESRTVITFQGRGRIDAQRLKAELPPDMGLVGIDEQDGMTAVTLSVPANARLRHFRSGRGVAVDIVRPADGAPPRPAGGEEAKVPLAPPPNAVESVPAVKPSAPAPKPPAQVVEEMRAQTPATPEQRPASLVFAWKDATAAAVFRRAGWLWIVFDRPQQVDLAGLRKAAGDTVSHIEQVPHRDATILRLITPPEYNPAVRRDGLQWIVDLARQPMRPTNPIEVRRHVEHGQTALFLPVAEGGVPLQMQDPEVGDQLQVVPVTPVGAGVYPGSELAEVEAPPTTQGILVVPRADGIAVKSSRTGITITAPGGLSLGAAGETPAVGMRHGEAPATAGSPLDIVGWSASGIEHFRAEKRRLEMRLGELPRGNRNPTRLELARLLVANGHHPEALSILRVMADDEPSITDTGVYRAVRGAAQLLMNRFDLALEDLSHPDILGAPEAALWRAVAQVSMGEGASQAANLEHALPQIQNYPPRLKIQMGFATAETLLEAGLEKPAGDVLAVLEAERLTRSQKERLAYLRGAHEQLAGNFEAAGKQWQAAEEGDNRLYRARAAMAHALLDLKTGATNQREAIKRLDKLRFAWRGDDFEFALLKRLGEMQIGVGDYAEGLRTLRQVAGNFGQHKSIQAVTQTMADTFERLFLGGAADALPPLTAIALFDEFRELTPSGDKGDQMIRKLADRLAGVDLLDRAGELLRHQVDFRLAGADKARVATQLAVLYLLDHKPEAALQVLDGSEMPDLPAGLQLQRRHLAAKALSDLGRAPDAIARLKGDASTNAKLLRAEIHWRQKNWAAAADAFAQLIVTPTPGAALDAESGLFVLHWATALNLANDEAGLTQLRAAYAATMAESPYRDAFTLLTSDVGAAAIDYRKVADKIREAEKFQAFIAAYRQRLQAEGLSAIN